MEGDDIFATMDSLWFYSSVLLQPPSKHKQRECAEELQPTQQQDSAETTSGSSGQAPNGVKEAAVATERRAAAATAEPRAAARCLRDREWDERMVAWQKEQRRRTRVAAAARCSQARMPPPGEGVAMKAHLRSWAHAVACSVR
ncbi:hypothetical protein GQ55_5G171400 [Panicum hallii var. hallii]|jgi:hypothetical protein|uniref:Uncharacterized protein n=2 Tax=Panicum hallii TaxID=206008 RepID=A0A2T7DH79_9POAL|nr:uncharacterized protein LOC112892335 [Panicum hallii]PAN28677.1 hypothetical protein PAHAL_5G171400 [Panicum hallii]PUZ54928.1 hypothetical protein GQ55_5G171400 [Panicum hallii var. hallii]